MVSVSENQSGHDRTVVGAAALQREAQEQIPVHTSPEAAAPGENSIPSQTSINGGIPPIGNIDGQQKEYFSRSTAIPSHASSSIDGSLVWPESGNSHELEVLPNFHSDQGQDSDRDHITAVNSLRASFGDENFSHPPIQPENGIQTQEKNPLVSNSEITADSNVTFQNPQDSRLDPLSADFDYEIWLKQRFSDPSHCKNSSTSVAFRNLNVYGYGAKTDYQKTFASYPLSIAENLFNNARKSRVDILRNFEGLVRRGEMLVVLGRPGSGCSTLLKTIAGRMHGIEKDEKSLINYEGNFVN
jgi:ABC-type multidrug transport system fused ATPase/permease subunit